MIKSIHHFNTELLGIKNDGAHLLGEQEYSWLLGALEEELNEFSEAQHHKDLPGCVDSLLDLTYFAIGGLVRMGLEVEQIEKCFEAVHTANMLKKMGIKDTRPQDGSIADAIKPTGWRPPEEAIRSIIFGDSNACN